MARKTLRSRRASARLRQVSEKGLRLILSLGAGAGARGTLRLATNPAAATAKPAPAIHAGCPPAPARTPPASVPSRMATKVPLSIKALPPTSSSSRRCCGRMAYLTGPKSVECRPSRNSALRRTFRLCR